MVSHGFTMFHLVAPQVLREWQLEEAFWRSFGFWGSFSAQAEGVPSNDHNTKQLEDHPMRDTKSGSHQPDEITLFQNVSMIREHLFANLFEWLACIWFD